MRIAIRPARVIDEAALVRIEKSSFRPRPFGLRRFRDVLQKHYGQAIVATDGGVVVGFVVFHAGWDSEADEGCAEIALMAVTPELRRRGVGTRMVRWVAKYARRPSFGAHRLRLAFRDCDEGARAFFAKLAFRDGDVRIERVLASCGHR